MAAQGGTRRRPQDNRAQIYVYGNAAPQYDVTEEIRKRPARKLSNSARRNREIAKHMSPGFLLYLSAALAVTGFILTGYIGLQSDITNSVQHISVLEKQLNDLKLANDEEYSRITSSVNLEEIKRIAIQELGMQYAGEGQIVPFSSEDNDYVKQMAEIPR